MNIIKTSPFIFMAIGFIFCPVKYYNFLDEDCNIEDDNNLFIYSRNYISLLNVNEKIETTAGGKIKKFEFKVPNKEISIQKNGLDSLKLEKELKERIEVQSIDSNNHTINHINELNLIFEYNLKE